ncbi:hypothetical protein [Streptomyces sp. NPDC050804]|uniref:hypothetical protein n=1 Tax=unclassified Streptomyces TaxID=2593676 RepID=UPI003443C752|nr:hypothetical protein OG214_17445 [Streptomyces sp. NBC_00872]
MNLHLSRESKYMSMKESASVVDGLASATAVASLVAAIGIIVLGFVARELMSKSSRVRRGETSSQAAGEGIRAALLGGVAAVLGHGVGSAMSGRWTVSFFIALEVLIYATALQFLTTSLIWRGWGPKSRGRAVVCAAVLALAGSAAWTYTA